MQAIAAKGGLIAIGYWMDVTCDASPTGVAATIAAAINLAGADHVSLGSDYNGSVETNFDTPKLAALTQSLLSTGVLREDVARLWVKIWSRFYAVHCLISDYSHFPHGKGLSSEAPV